ncbi:Tetratricopeptide repeat protein 1 [Seminavis robusta]|uniref:Tetratricopeptide repeat protein 1 n=1 Tax=Seminavis robusta TaxID=568900 RepID=A0A9N8EBC7_9STRA|nr:Tetratricopeptide repeat protein 1 [Seminavis robusta]|eukprot:Sro715_g191790.1 Tetratricopeptide repeat protein 1 (299) ;mRNA; f:34965-35958
MVESTFASDGFDLDAIPDSGDGEVVYEVGGMASIVESEKPESKDADPTSTAQPEEPSPLAESEKLKAQGNEEFKNKNYLEALDMYTSAIEACPGMTGKGILAQRDEFDEKERKRLHEVHRLQAQKRAAESSGEDGDKSKTENATIPARDFEAPSHPHGKELAIYHSNRAACSLSLKRYEDAIQDCDVAILLRPDWAKAYVRRSTAFENLEEQTDKALSDAKKALELDPKNAAARKNVQRLQKIEDERLEKLKEETLGKLKELGNSILGNFGLSMDNFQANQDPSTGSYNISFNQGAQK